MQNKNSWLQCLVLFFLALLPAAYAQQYSSWSTAVHLPGPVNIPLAQNDPSISKDGLSLYFTCQNCPGGYGGWDLYVSRFNSIEDAWGAPENLGPNINTDADETKPVLSLDGHRLYFASNRGDAIGNNGSKKNTDIYVSRRRNKWDDFGWGLPDNPGEGVNTPMNEAPGSFFEDDSTGAVTFYFQSDRLGSLGDDHIFASVIQPDDSFGPATLIEELKYSGFDDNHFDRHASVRRDGLEIFLTSNREGSIHNPKGANSVDIWTSTRASTSDPWSQPVNVDPAGSLYINTGRHEGGAVLSFDGTMLYFFAAQRAENVSPGCPLQVTCAFDIWMTTREKLTGTELGK